VWIEGGQERERGGGYVSEKLKSPSIARKSVRKELVTVE